MCDNDSDTLSPSNENLRNRLISDIQAVGSANIELLHQVNTHRSMRVGSIREMTPIHSMNQIRDIEVSVKDLRKISQVVSSNLEQLVESVDTCTEDVYVLKAQLCTHRYLNSHLGTQAALCKRYNSPSIILRFYFIPTDISFISQKFLRVQKDSPIEHIISRLPPQWGVSMSSTFLPSHDQDLDPFNTPGALLWNLPAWLRYVRLGGVIFVSPQTSDIDTKFTRVKRPRHRVRCWEAPGLARISEHPKILPKIKIKLKHEIKQDINI